MGVRAIKVDYEELPPVLDLASAAKPDSPLTRNDKNSNVAFALDFPRGDEEG